ETSARVAPAVKPGARQSIDRQATVQGLRPKRPRSDSAQRDRAANISRKLSPDPCQALAQANAVCAPGFGPAAELPPMRARLKMAAARSKDRIRSRLDCRRQLQA